MGRPPFLKFLKLSRAVLRAKASSGEDAFGLFQEDGGHGGLLSILPY